MIARLAALALLACIGAACQRVDDTPVVDVSEERGKVQRYVFGTTDGEELSAAGMQGRVTALLFVTTFDLASQVAAKRLNQALHTHTPRINAGAVVLEAARYAPLADVFRSTLQLTYPVAIADLALVEQSSTFGEVRSVPTLIVLNAEGRETMRRSGAFTQAELDGWLRQAE